jgi:hypothetical protein
MMLLAGRLGYVQLAEPVRFTAAWEHTASLRLRRGATALDDYDQHGRIRGAPPDEAMDQAAKAYVACYLAGHDVILTAADWARCRELSQRIRDDLIHLGHVDNGQSVEIAEGAEASPGDLVICRDNDHRIQAREPGRGLANGDILRIEAITPAGIHVRRMLDPDPATGERRFTDRAFCYRGYQSCDLAYAVTGHSAQGGTVHTGITLVTGGEDRQWLYAAMTRGTDHNLVFVSTTPPKVADPAPGTRPAPELERYERTRHECAGYLPARLAAPPGGPDPREPIAVLADILGRDGTQLSASETKQRNLANAGLTVGPRRNDIPVLHVGLLPDHDKVTVGDRRADHGVTGDLEHEQRPLADQLLRQRDSVIEDLLSGVEVTCGDLAHHIHRNVGRILGREVQGSRHILRLQEGSGPSGHHHLHRARAARIRRR